jgi:anti-anti-sigma regulatory factor
VPAVSRFIVDLRSVHYADSAALGMLFLLRDYAGDAERIVVAHCRGQPEQVLRIARIHEVFQFV